MSNPIRWILETTFDLGWESTHSISMADSVQLTQDGLRRGIEREGSSLAPWAENFTACSNRDPPLECSYPCFQVTWSRGLECFLDLISFKFAHVIFGLTTPPDSGGIGCSFFPPRFSILAGRSGAASARTRVPGRKIPSICAVVLEEPCAWESQRSGTLLKLKIS